MSFHFSLSLSFFLPTMYQRTNSSGTQHQLRKHAFSMLPKVIYALTVVHRQNSCNVEQHLFLCCSILQLWKFYAIRCFQKHFCTYSKLLIPSRVCLMRQWDTSKSRTRLSWLCISSKVRTTVQSLAFVFRRDLTSVTAAPRSILWSSLDYGSPFKTVKSHSHLVFSFQPP